MRWCFLENFLCLSVPAVAKVTLGQEHALLFHCIVTLYDSTTEEEGKIKFMSLIILGFFQLRLTFKVLGGLT